MKGLLAFSVVFLAAACVSGSVLRSDDLEDSTCPEEGLLVPHPDCSKYYICDNGILIIQACSVGTIFNPREGICDFPTNVPECVGGTRPPDTTGTTTTSTTTTSPNTTTTRTTTTTTTTEAPTTPEEIITTEVTEPPKNTTRTTTRRTTTTTTEAPTDPTTSEDLETTTEQVTTRNTTRTTTTTTTEAPTDATTEWNIETTTADNRICKNDGVYTLPVAGNCTLYILCVNGQAVQQQCPPDTFFDPEFGACNLADLVEECSAPLCAEGEIVFKPVPGNCTAFILCANGETSTGTCPPGTLFDPVFLQCNVASSVDCEDGSTGNSTTSYMNQNKKMAAKTLTKEEKSGVQGFFGRMFG